MFATTTHGYVEDSQVDRLATAFGNRLSDQIPLEVGDSQIFIGEFFSQNSTGYCCRQEPFPLPMPTPPPAGLVDLKAVSALSTNKDLLRDWQFISHFGEVPCSGTGAECSLARGTL